MAQVASTWWVWLIAIGATVLTFVCSTVGFAARDLSRAKLEAILERRGKEPLLDPLHDAEDDIAFLAAVGRLCCNLLLVIAVFDATGGWFSGLFAHYAVTLVVSGVVALLFSVLLPHALAEHVGEVVVATLGKLLIALTVVFKPLTAVKDLTNTTVDRISGGRGDDDPDDVEEEYEAELLSAVEEGEKEGAFDNHEREMIERAIVFGNREVSEAMTARPDIVALPADATLDQIRDVVIESGHSRIPVYDGDLDHVVGILYARDLIHRVAKIDTAFEIGEAMRPPLFVFEGKPLPDLLQDFRLKKIHIAIVQDEFGATAGVCSIEDVLEELVGEISDEHEPAELAYFNKLAEDEADCDARLHIDDLNRMFGLELSEEEDYDTLGGFVLTHLGRIPAVGTTFDFDDARFTVTDAEPHRITRVNIKLVRPAEPVVESA
ncbi:MAG: hemolysin family protein [Planctomycetota bacterium]